MKNEIQKVNTKNNVQTVTSNKFITAMGLQKLSLKARKLLYIAISQCKMNDDQFYEYTISVPEFVSLMGLKSDSNIYGVARSVARELFKTSIEIEAHNNKEFEIYSIFSKCRYANGSIEFKINTDMTDLFLNLKNNFSKPLLNDFLHMNSNYSMEIWHLFQREMKSRKPSMTQTIEFEISLEELRKVTGTEKKFKQIGQFKEKVLDKAIREILDNCAVRITYENIKVGRTIVGFKFMANSLIHIDEDRITEETRRKIKRINDRIDKK